MSESPGYIDGAAKPIDTAPPIETDTPAAIAGRYFDASVRKGQGGKLLENDAETVTAYKDAYVATAISIFGDLIARANTENNSNPLLGELSNILFSADHNKGVYYQKAEVIQLFQAVTESYFREPSFIEGLREGNIDSLLQERVSSLASLTDKHSTGLIKGVDGQWRIVDTQTLDSTSAHKIMEMIRQDNQDKQGWNKYRFRETTYIHGNNNSHTQEVGNGWYTSEWEVEPTYWAQHMRDLIQNTSNETEEALGSIGATSLFVTEGGIYKGTSTADTDLDTECWVLCNSAEDFDRATDLAMRAFENQKARLPFGLKKGAQVSIRLYDKSSRKEYFKLTNPPRYQEVRADIDEEGLPDEIRSNESGIMLTAHGRSVMFAKPAEYKDKTIYMKLSSRNLQVSDISTQTHKGYLVNAGITNDSDLV